MRLHAGKMPSWGKFFETRAGSIENMSSPKEFRWYESENLLLPDEKSDGGSETDCCNPNWSNHLTVTCCVSTPSIEHVCSVSHTAFCMSSWMSFRAKQCPREGLASLYLGPLIEEGLCPAHMLAILRDSAAVVRILLSSPESTHPTPSVLLYSVLAPCSVKDNESSFALLLFF